MQNGHTDEEVKKKQQEALEAIRALRERKDRGDSRPGDSQVLRAISDEATQEIEKCKGKEEEPPKSDPKADTQILRA